MTTSPTSPALYLAALAPSPIGTHQSRSVVEMEEKENVNQNSKITEFPIQNNVCFPSPPDDARRLYDHFLSLARIRGVKVGTGEFGATMQLNLVSSGPVTIILDSRENVKSR